MAFQIHINSGVCTIALASGSTLGPLVPSFYSAAWHCATQRRHAQLQVQSGGRQEKLRLGSGPRPVGGYGTFHMKDLCSNSIQLDSLQNPSKRSSVNDLGTFESFQIR